MDHKFKQPMLAGNTNALSHGGGKARQQLTTGEEFTGPAALAEVNVRTELAINGRVSVVERAAIRLQAVSDLYYAALVAAGERNDEKKLASYAKTFGWLQAKALSAWQQLKAEQADAPDGLDYEQILATRENEPAE